MKNRGRGWVLWLTRNPKIADSGPAGRDFNPACPEPRRVGHPDARIASSAYSVYPGPVGVSLRLVLLRLSTYNLKLTTANFAPHQSYSLGHKDAKPEAPRYLAAGARYACRWSTRYEATAALRAESCERETRTSIVCALPSSAGGANARLYS